MTMELQLNDAKLMKTIIDPMLPVGEDIYIEISENGFRANCKGIASAWAADAVLSGQVFDKIEVDGTAKYFLKLKDFADFMKTVQSDDALTIRENQDKGTLELILYSDHTEMTKKIAIRLLQLPEDFKIFDTMNSKGGMTKSPDHITSSSEIQTDLFSQAVKAAELGGNEVILTNNTSGLNFEAEDATKNAEAKISYESKYVQNVEFHNDKKECVGIYKLEFLRHVARIGKSGDTISLWMLDQGPLILVYSFQEDADKERLGYIGFAIAPRTKPDE